MAYLMGSDNEGIVVKVNRVTDNPQLVLVTWRPAVIKSKKTFLECVEREEVKAFSYIYDAVARRTFREVHFYETREKPEEARKHTFADKQVRRKLEGIIRQVADEQEALRVREAEALAARAQAGRAERARARAARDEDAIPLADLAEPDIALVGLAEPAMVPAGRHKVGRVRSGLHKAAQARTGLHKTARVRAYPDDRAMREAARERYGGNKVALAQSGLHKAARARADPDDTAMARTAEIAKAKQTSALVDEDEQWANDIEELKSANSVNGPQVVLPEGLNAVPVSSNEAWKEEVRKGRNKKAKMTSAASTSSASTSSASTSAASTSAASKAGRRRTATSVEGSRDDPMDIQCLPFPHC